MPTLAASTTSQLSSHEDFINKSLLDSLDAQADAEPVSSSDSEQAIARSYGSASNSSSGGGSPSVPYHVAMQTHHPSITHPDSPVFETINQHIHPQDSIYAHQNNMYSSSAISENALNLHTDYASDQDSRKYLQQQAKPDIFPNAHRASFTSYPNATRQRHPTTRSGLPSANQYRDSFYPTSAADIFPPAMTSPVQSHMQAFEPRSSYDFINGQVNMNGGLYNPSVNMFQSHQVNGNKPQQQQQSQHSAYAAPYSNGPHISSQTPYGPHVPAGTAAPSSIIGTTAGISGPPGLAPLPNMPVVNGSNAPANPEEISTIFVVGFPEDMQVRSVFINTYITCPDNLLGARVPEHVYLFSRFRSGHAQDPE